MQHSTTSQLRAAAFLAALLCAPAAPAKAQFPQGTILPKRADAEVPDLGHQTRAVLGLAHCEVVSLDLPDAGSGPFAIASLSPATPIGLELEPHSVRAGEYELLVREPRGLLPVEATAPKTVRGRIVGDTQSAVAGALLPSGLHARIVRSTGEELWIEPLWGRIDGATRSQHVLYHTSDVLVPPNSCGTDTLAGATSTSAEGFAIPNGAQPGVRFAEIACDTDHEFFTQLGSVTAAQDRIELVLNVMNLQFERDVDITHEVTTIVVQTSPNQPYNSTDSTLLLEEFRDHWNASHALIRRDVAQLFTGKDLDGSIIGSAWPGTLCGPQGYSVVQSNFSPVLSLVTDLSAHELGHNWGADHCSCPTNTMNPFITGTNKFHPLQTVPDITQHRDAAACLDGGPGRDLVFTSVEVSNVLGHGGTYVVQGTLRNRGSERVTGLIEVSAFLSLDDVPLNGNDLFMGATCVSVDLGYEESTQVQFASLPVPPTAVLTTQHFLLCADTTGALCGGAPPCSIVCEVNEFNNCRDQLVSVLGPDAQITAIDVQDSAQTGDCVSVGFTARNNGPFPVDIPVNVCIGPNCAPTVWLLNVQPGQSASGNTCVFAPDSVFDCGAPQTFIASACANLAIDSAPGNNCLSSPISIIENWWDLRFDVINEPSSASLNSTFTFAVRVTNHGNTTSPSVCAIAGIDLHPGPGNWNANLGIINLSTGQIAPGDSRTFPLTYFIPNFALCNRTQYLKTEIHYSANCDDLCGAGNYDEEPIFISCF